MLLMPESETAPQYSIWDPEGIAGNPGDYPINGLEGDEQMTSPEADFWNRHRKPPTNAEYANGNLIFMKQIRNP
jgi:hypothetical protein